MSNFTATPIKTRTGRIVYAGGPQNSLYDPKTTDYDGNVMTIKSGQNAGQVTQRFDFGLAIAKGTEKGWWETPEGAIILAQGQKDHPAASQRADFAWKVVDGDSKVPGKVRNGKPTRPPCEKEGYPGHWVYQFSSTYPIKFVNRDGSAYVLDVGAVKVGDFVQVLGDTVGNSGATPGVYLNHRYVSLQWPGDPIQAGPLPSEAGFGDNGPKPVGAYDTRPVSGLPPVGVPAAAPAIPAAAAPALPPAAAVAQAATPQAVVPHPAILLPPTGAPAAPMAPAVPAGPKLTAKAQGATWEQMLANNWTLDLARQHGMIE